MIAVDERSEGRAGELRLPEPVDLPSARADLRDRDRGDTGADAREALHDANDQCAAQADHEAKTEDAEGGEQHQPGPRLTGRDGHGMVLNQPGREREIET